MIHKLTISLKQHTPLIHFQHDQDGATLRASEVKPKLDKFILTELGKGNYIAGCKQAKESGWLVGKGEHPAMDYKMNSHSTRNQKEYLLASYIKPEIQQNLRSHKITAISDTPFFAQEKQNGQIYKSREPQNEWNKIEKKGLLSNDPITITIVSQNSSLIPFISKQIQPFFLTTNFGTRQSKGFGCFTVEEIKLDNSNVELKNNEELLKKYFLFVYKKNIKQFSVENILATINDDYRLIKSGQTRPFYAKSKLMLYVDYLDKTIGWDKKYIKVNTNETYKTEKEGVNYKLKCKESNRHFSYSKRKSYKYFRALLGLAEQYEFLLDNPPLGDNKNKMIIKVKNDDIQRYQSPLLFKIIGSNIYLVGNEVSPRMLNKPFYFFVNFQKDKGYKDEPIEETGTPIMTPSVFSLKEFISFAMKDNTNKASLGYLTIKQ